MTVGGNRQSSVETVTADFYGDWTELLRQELVAEGFEVPEDEVGDAVCRRYFNVLWKQIPPQPRVVREADTFLVPDAHAGGFAALRAKIEKGEPLLPHMSKSIADPGYHDLLFNDWYIHHLHLGSHKTGPFADRTEQLLFVRFTDTDACLIAIGKHGDWTRQEMLETVLRNWPELLEADQIRGLDPGGALTDDELAVLRSKRGTALLTLSDGNVYAPPGGGYAGTGLSFQVRRMIDGYADALEDIERWVQENVDSLRRQAAERGRDMERNPSFELVAFDRVPGGVVPKVVERSSMIQFTIPTEFA